MHARGSNPAKCARSSRGTFPSAMDRSQRRPPSSSHHPFARSAQPEPRLPWTRARRHCRRCSRKGRDIALDQPKKEILCQNVPTFLCSFLMVNQAYVVNGLNCYAGTAARRSILRHEAAVWMDVVWKVQSPAWRVQIAVLPVVTVGRVHDGIIEWLQIAISKMENAIEMLSSPFVLAFPTLSKRFGPLMSSSFRSIVHLISICLKAHLSTDAQSKAQKISHHSVVLAVAAFSADLG